MLQSTGLQTVRHNLETKQQQLERCIVQYGSQKPQVSIEHLNCDWSELGFAGNARQYEDLIQKKNAKYHMDRFYTADMLTPYLRCIK